MWGLGRGRIPCQLDGPGYTSRQGVGGGIAKGRHFERIFEDLGGRMGEMTYLWHVASQAEDADGGGRGRRNGECSDFR